MVMYGMALFHDAQTLGLYWGRGYIWKIPRRVPTLHFTLPEGVHPPCPPLHVTCNTWTTLHHEAWHGSRISSSAAQLLKKRAFLMLLQTKTINIERHPIVWLVSLHFSETDVQNYELRLADSEHFLLRWLRFDRKCNIRCIWRFGVYQCRFRAMNCYSGKCTRCNCSVKKLLLPT